MNRINKGLIAIENEGSFRVYLAITTKMVEDAREVHDTTPLATAALGRVLTGAGLMGMMLKNPEDKLTLQFKGDGPGGEILTTAAGSGQVKGYISNPDVDLPLRNNGKLDVGGAVGSGSLTVVRDMGMKDPYYGRISLVTGEIADDLTEYFFVSEQQPTSVSLGVRIAIDRSVAAAGGMIIQVLPECKVEVVEKLEKMVEGMQSVSLLVEDVTAKGAGKTPEELIEDLLHKIFHSLSTDLKVTTLEYRDVYWKCDCNHERLEQVLMSIGEKDLMEIIEEDGKAELTCQFCGKKYNFEEKNLRDLLAEIKQK